MSIIRELYTSMLKETLDYIIEDVDDAQLFSMVALVAREAEKNAAIRKEKRLQEQYKAEQQTGFNTNPLRDFNAAQQLGGALRHG